MNVSGHPGAVLRLQRQPPAVVGQPSMPKPGRFWYVNAGVVTVLYNTVVLMALK